MNTVHLGRLARATRLRQRLRQEDVAARAGVSRSVVSLVERGQWSALAVRSVEATLEALGARLIGRLAWNGTELDRLIDARHAALAASEKDRLERWGWLVRVEVSYSRYGERGRIDLLAWRSPGVLLVVEVKTDLVDVQALLGGMDAKARLARHVVEPWGWPVRHVVPAIVFLEDRTTRRRLDQLAGLFDRYELRGLFAITWLRHPGALGRRPAGVLWFRSLPNARLARISGQRVRLKQRRRPP